MKAAILEDEGKIVIREVNDLTPGPGDILIETKYAGVCGSDIHAFKGIHPFRKPPVILGHEVSGTIAEMGRAVKGFQAGEQVTVMPLIACQECLLCRMGRQNICAKKKVPGTEGWLGSFAEFFLSKPSITYKLAENTSLEVGVLAEPFAVAIHSVYKQARVQRESKVLILGGGTIGILTALAARIAGAREIVITDLFDFNLKITKGLCRAETYTANREDLADVILGSHPERFDITFLCSGATSTVRQGMTLTRRGGRIIVTGMFLKSVPMELTMVNLNELEIIGSGVYTPDDFQKAVEYIDSGSFDLKRLITHIFPLERAQYAVNLLIEHEEDAIKILLDLKK